MLLGCFRLAGSYAELAYLRSTKQEKVVPRAVELEVSTELAGDDEGPVVDEHGTVLRRVGACLRIAKEVKLRFGGTPKLSEANKLLAARYIDEALVEHGVTRKIDRAKMMYKIRALVFTRLREEREEDQWTNSATAAESHDGASGWGRLLYDTVLGLTVPWSTRVGRRVVVAA